MSFLRHLSISSRRYPPNLAKTLFVTTAGKFNPWLQCCTVLFADQLHLQSQYEFSLSLIHKFLLFPVVIIKVCNYYFSLFETTTYSRMLCNFIFEFEFEVSLPSLTYPSCFRILFVIILQISEDIIHLCYYIRCKLFGKIDECPNEKVGKERIWKKKKASTAFVSVFLQHTR